MQSKEKHIAVITPGILPIPCTKGGAVESLIEFYLQENEKLGLFKFHVYSIYDKEAESISTHYTNTSFHFFNPKSLHTRINQYLYKTIESTFYYNPYMDYFGHWAIKQIQKETPQLLIIENRQGFILNKSLKVTCPKVLHLHNDSLNIESNKAASIIQKFDKIITVSNYLKKQIEKVTPNNKTQVVYNGIDLTKFNTSKPIFERANFQLSANDFVVIYIGRISPIKGIKELLEAFVHLKDYPNIKLLIVGGNSSGNDCDSFLTEMQQMAKEIGEQVKFSGYISHQNIPSILHLGDIGIIPSTCEDALTLSSIESMAMGLPLIVTRSGGIPEAVTTQCSIIIEKDENLVSNISNSIKYLYTNTKLREDMSKAAKERSKEFSKSNYVHQFIQSIQSLME